MLGLIYLSEFKMMGCHHGDMKVVCLYFMQMPSLLLQAHRVSPPWFYPLKTFELEEWKLWSCPRRLPRLQTWQLNYFSFLLLSAFVPQQNVFTDQWWRQVQLFETLERGQLFWNIWKTIAVAGVSPVNQTQFWIVRSHKNQRYSWLFWLYPSQPIGYCLMLIIPGDDWW